MIVQIAGLAINVVDHLQQQQVDRTSERVSRVQAIYRAIATAPPASRPAVLATLPRSPGITATISPSPPITELPAMDQGRLRYWLGAPVGNPAPDAAAAQPSGVAYGAVRFHRVVLGMRLTGGTWLNFDVITDPPSPFLSPTFTGAFSLMTVMAVSLTLWAVRRLTAPLRTLATAAERLGQDVNAPPLPEDGPQEIATAAVAFNTMAARIRRFIDDRTALLAAIGHDLRTPITRMKLRAEFMEDDELRGKMLADLEEMQAMVSATLIFGRDARTSEPMSRLDLAELLKTIIEEIGDARPEQTEHLRFTGPRHLTINARPLAMKRALTNLIVNALNYGGSAAITLESAMAEVALIEITDNGPGIPTADLERVFEPFYRVEISRNRETGGTGLGLPIARDILRAHGGQVTLANRAEGGLKATVRLPL